MKEYRIISDSGCDISKEDEERYGIDIMSFDVILGNETFRERTDITGHDFLEKIANCEDLPKTSQITEFRFEEKFEECVKAGVKDVIVVLINGAGSHTYANAVSAAEHLKEDGRAGSTRFHILDSHTYSTGYGYPIIEAAKKLEAGQTVDMAVAYLIDWFDSCELYLMLFNLRHAKKSGRIKAAAAVMGELMNIKPIVQMIDDETKVVAKPRGEKKAVNELVDYLMTRAVPKTPFVIGRSLATELEDEFIEKYKAKSGSQLGYEHSVGSVVAANAGT
ncbi:MAG: DegV family EDD domain-containing protein, partial [Ruminiclostridium sp.]|nr:DegV family EDD domain-containing protein [Ruminiclostridium sp.]